MHLQAVYFNVQYLVLHTSSNTTVVKDDLKKCIHRGLKTYSRQEGWAGFKQCVKQEMRAAT